MTRWHITIIFPPHSSTDQNQRSDVRRLSVIMFKDMALLRNFKSKSTFAQPPDFPDGNYTYVSFNADIFLLKLNPVPPS